MPKDKLAGAIQSGTIVIPIYPSEDAVPQGETYYCLTSDTPDQRTAKALAKAAADWGVSTDDMKVFSAQPEIGGWGISCGYEV